MNKKYQNNYHVGSIRLQYWDYSSPASYFITICTHDRLPHLGTIRTEDAVMLLSPTGEIVAHHIAQLPTYHQRIIIDASVIMPNHIHLIITLADYDFNNGISNIATPPPPYVNPDMVKDRKIYAKMRRKMLLFDVLGKFKMQASKQINQLNKAPGTPNWQHDYYEHIIRNPESHEQIRYYIANNPSNWKSDKFHP